MTAYALLNLGYMIMRAGVWLRKETQNNIKNWVYVQIEIIKN